MPGPADRQQRIAGFEQDKLANAVVLVVGQGAIGGHVTYGLARKGVGRVLGCDGDTFDVTNRSRQLCRDVDLELNKAIAVAQNVSALCCMGTEVVGFPMDVEDLLDELPDLHFDLAVVAVDRNRTRRRVAELLYQQHVPGVFIALTETADGGYVFTQKPGGACLGCVLGENLMPRDGIDRDPCPGVPAILDSALLAVSYTLFAVDSLLMPGRKRGWNFRLFSLAGFTAETPMLIERRADCPLCSAVSAGT